MNSFTHPISFVKEAAPLAHMCWSMGWNEANGGNFSWRLPRDEISAILARHYPDLAAADPVAMPIDAPDLEGEIFLVTGSGQFFRHALEKPNQVFGIVQIVQGGTAWRKLWGFSSGAQPTSEFATHLAAHAIRKRVSGGRERMILHCHPPEFIALSFVMPLESRALTCALWKMMPECIVIFPDGVRVVPLLLPGTVEIAEASAAELERSRVISWSHHGIFASEENPDKIFALVETVEKASAIHRRVLSAGGARQVIDTKILRQLTEKFGALMVAKPEFLE
ncbi:rhamnulose-1-phosphate aldolase [Salipiger sp. 1_MG-2023]|uniref:rhamnulose-1-phosphate aldolase n=1 Tax=Salipiger sp. 1_MG-2023 TaxID=3062665 RepID=UPI0026E1348F|nr:rhamnulose-1-phosphate aldolase [Salipiger sp. 1_MG-2023]MDO6587235.1 rhamnulose-1-phosphate aldolase [Salipiger sp. 1_MG-2023]